MPCEHSSGDEPCPRCNPTLESGGDAPFREAPTLSSDGQAPPRRTRPEEEDLSWELTGGAQVGRYVIQELLGQGNMGVVYRAQDPELGREVAVKLLRGNLAVASDGDSHGQLRLLREAQAMAQLSHPNVLPVYDVGKYAQSVFLAMELVRGTTLSRWMRRKPLRPWREVLDVFLETGRGLVAAHAAGLVHRDFKPANVLIGDDGRPRVGDFGLARSTKQPELPMPRSEDESEPPEQPSGPTSFDTPLTRAGALLGTPGYMAPEQYAGGETSAATDQFAFCVSLYEGLYGQRPFVGSHMMQVGYRTTTAPVPPPPKGSQVPAWVHRVIEQGLAKRPDARHASMQALLDALAKDPDKARRRQLTVAAAVALVVLAAGGIGLNAWRSVACRGADQRLASVWNDEVRHRAEAAFAGSRRSYAGLAWRQAQAQLDAYAAGWVQARTEACEATRLRHEQTAAQLELRNRCLDHRLNELAALANTFATADADVVDQAGTAVGGLSRFDECAHVKDLEERRRPPPEAARAVDDLLDQLAAGRAYVAAGRYGPARERILPAVDAAMRLKLPAPLAEATLALGELELRTQQFPQARDALESATRFGEAAGDDARAARALSLMVSLVGWRLERTEEGRALAAIAMGKLERIGGDPRLEATVMEGLGDTEYQAGRTAESVAMYRKALERFVAIDGPQSGDVARLRASLGWLLVDQGALGEAREELERARAVREKLLGADHPELADSWSALGYVAHARGDAAESAWCHERSLSIRRQTMGDASLATARAALNLAEALADAGETDRSAKAIAVATAALEAHPEAPTSYRVQALKARGMLEASRGRWADAVAADRESLALAEASVGPGAQSTVEVGLALAAALDRLGRHGEALDVFDRFLALDEKAGREHTPAHADALLVSAQSLQALGRAGEGRERLERAVSLLALEADPARAAAARLALADALWTSRGDRSRARELASQAREAWAKASRAEDARRAGAWLDGHGPQAPSR